MVSLDLHFSGYKNEILTVIKISKEKVLEQIDE